MKHITLKIPEVIRHNFRFGTLNFLFIILYVNVFQFIFGPENSIVGVIFTIMMSASMARDLTATPIRHFLIQALVLVWMALAAFLVGTLSAPWSLCVNFITLLLILYAYTYEYSSHLYFPYILSYLFLVFISPINASQLPKRLAAMLVGALSIILYQWFMGRKRVVETARDVLTEMIDDVCGAASGRLEGTVDQPDTSRIRKLLCRLSHTVYERRKNVLSISDASFSMIAAGRGLEHLLILIKELPEELSAQEKAILEYVSGQLKIYQAFLKSETESLPPVDEAVFTGYEEKKVVRLFYHALLYTRDRLLHMSDPKNKTHYKKTALSLKMRLETALDFSAVRAVYAVRVALLLSLATLLVQNLALPHGKWLLFTLASVSLPYADDVPVKIKKRVLATLVGGLVSVVIYSLVPSAAGRTAAMMISGYLSFYFTDYAQTFACSTIGALGGAVFMGAFGLEQVGGMFLIRIGYILAGVIAGYLVNCLIFPYSRAQATSRLWRKYTSLTELLAKICRRQQMDSQLYYNLMVQVYLLEEKLTQNASLEKWKEFPEILAEYQEKIRHAHRKLIAGREDAPVFDAADFS